MTAPTTAHAQDPVDAAIGEVDHSRWPDIVAPRRPRVPLVAAAQARVAWRLFQTAVNHLPVAVHLPDGRVLGHPGTDVFEDPETPVMVVYRPEAFARRLGADGLIGFGESYMAGDWDSPDLGAFLTVLARRLSTLVPAPLQAARRLHTRRPPRADRSTTRNARRNIARHYDLSNDLFALFLDETMTYSSAVFPVEDALATLPAWEDLAPAQRHKIDLLLDAAGVRPGTHLLEIGTGWGELAIRAAARGARVHSVTLSTDQLQLARERVRAAGHEDAVTIELQDYRDVSGTYDAIISVEMIEAVGHQFWQTYFETLDALVRPGGRVAIQAITMPHARMLATKNTWTWIQKYIFPGGFLPSTEVMREITGRHTRLRETSRLRLGAHYAATLRLWDERFTAQAEEVQRLGFDAVFRRMWHFYLEYSRAGFASGYIDVQQLTFTKESA